MQTESKPIDKFRLEPTLLDRFVSYWSPARGAARLMARRNGYLHAKRAYEAASVGRRTDGWRTTGASASSEAAIAGPLIRERARDIVQNNPYGERALDVIANNTIGPAGMKAKIVGSERLIKAFKKWSKTKQCDAEGLSRLDGMQEIVMRGTPEGGEMLLRRRWRRESDGLVVPMQVQLLEPDMLDNSRDRTGGKNAGGAFDNRIQNGIEYDAIGRRVAYWLHREHPGNNRMMFPAQRSVRVPARDIHHVFLPKRAGQQRGVSWFAPVAIRLKDWDEFTDATLFRQKLANCFMGWRINLNAGVEDPNGVKTKDGDPLDRMEPGAIDELGPGEDIKLNDPPGAPDHEKFSREILHGIAAGLGISFEALTGILSEVNFSSARMGWLEFYRAVTKWQNRLIIPMMDRIFEWFVEAAELAGIDVEGAEVSWTPPRRDMVDPSKEVKPFKEAVRGGFLSLPEAQRQLGQDPDEVLKETAEYQKKADAAGVVWDTDPRHDPGGSEESSDDDGDGKGDDDDGAGGKKKKAAAA